MPLIGARIGEGLVGGNLNSIIQKLQFQLSRIAQQDRLDLQSNQLDARAGEAALDREFTLDLNTSREDSSFQERLLNLGLPKETTREELQELRAQDLAATAEEKSRQAEIEEIRTREEFGTHHPE